MTEGIFQIYSSINRAIHFLSHLRIVLNVQFIRNFDSLSACHKFLQYVQISKNIPNFAFVNIDSLHWAAKTKL